MPNLPDCECIRRTLAGNREAFGVLYRTYYPQIYATIARRVPDRDGVEDLVQITFMRAFRALRTFRGDAAFSTWLTQIALNVCTSYHRSRKRREWLLSVEDPDVFVDAGRMPDTYENPEAAVDRKQRREMVVEGIRSLPARYRKAMWLRYVQDRSYEEITRSLQVPMGTVKTWLCRSRRQLKGKFRRLGLLPV